MEKPYEPPVVLKFHEQLFHARQPKMKEAWGGEPWGQTLYRLALPGIRQDATVLDFAEIDRAVATSIHFARAENKTHAIPEKMIDLIRTCQTRDPTPAGLLDLKQALKSTWGYTP